MRWRTDPRKLAGATLGGLKGVACCGLAALGLVACGSSAPTLKAPCRATGRTVAAHAFGVAEDKVSATASTGNNGSPQCSYAVGRRSIVVNVNTTPQPYFILERTAVEASQQFSTKPEIALPEHVGGIGLDAFWFPAASQFETTDGVRLITVTVTLPGARQARLSAVGKAAARPYVGKLVQPPGFQG